MVRLPQLSFRVYENIVTKEAYYMKTYRHLKFHDPVFRGATVVPVSQVHEAAILIVLICRKLKVRKVE
jgi:hypothetical protein